MMAVPVPYLHWPYGRYGEKKCGIVADQWNAMIRATNARDSLAVDARDLSALGVKYWSVGQGWYNDMS